MLTDEPIRSFNALHEQYRTLGVSTHLIDPQTDFTIFNLKDVADKLPFQAPVSRLNFYIFNFIKTGRGTYTIDDQQFTITPGTVYLTNPGHYRSYEWTQIEEVYLVTVGESFLREHVHAAIFDEFPFLLAETFPARVLPVDLFAELERIYRQIHKEYTAQSPFRHRLIASLLIVLLLKIKEYCWLDYNPIYEGNRSSLIVKNFKRLLEHHYRELSTGVAQSVFRVQEYAEAQHLHPNYLSTVIKTKTGKSVGTWIAEKTMAEAKALLQSSPLSIKEIGYRLGFSEPAHFSNYFKKHSSNSPAQYRKEHAETAS